MIVASAGSSHGPGWVSFVVAAGIAVFATIAAVRIWKGVPVIRRNSSEQERGLNFAMVAIPPTAIAFSSVAIGDLCLNLRGTHLGQIADGILLLVAFLMGITFVGGVIVAASLFLFRWPRTLIPPPLRQ
jgi:hypothetical protein